MAQRLLRRKTLRSPARHTQRESVTRGLRDGSCLRNGSCASRAVRSNGEVAMRAMQRSLSVASVAIGLAFAPPALADLFTFSTGNPDGRLGSASRPGGAGTL